jgi:hypothetical protein
MDFAGVQDKKCSNCANPAVVMVNECIPVCMSCNDMILHAMQEFNTLCQKPPNQEDVYIVNDMDQILDNLYLGSEEASIDRDLLLSKNITHILVCADGLPKHYPEDFVYSDLPIYDLCSQDLFPYFKTAFEFISKGKMVLVHCRAGVSRSASIVIAFLMATRNMSYKEAYWLVRGKRDVICPNAGFIEQLKRLEGMIKSKEFVMELEDTATAMQVEQLTQLYDQCSIDSFFN